MVDQGPRAPRISSAQRLWLLELGVEKPLLARFDIQKPRPAPPSERAVAVQPSVEPTSLLRRPVPAAEPHQKTQPVPVKPPAAVESPTDWASLEARIQACEACELYAGRQRAVAGSGALENVQWLVVGEAPGERDDRLGQPFQGKAGELLQGMLHAAGIDPSEAIFYTNLVKCRPRSNRLPTAQEIASCLPHLHSQIALLKPRGILALGRLAAQTLLATETQKNPGFEALRGKVQSFTLTGVGTFPVVVTYHPASLLSRPRHKGASWRDLNLARDLGKSWSA
ncbi:uracil-DNA glycosylase [Pusillimonas sp. (ex Stolz et al. 2005)]|uniref:uracil-DNA glycosylase n=1 Tax=Pusillimonas sp. (ex Stolz et al. 2005) TaxID=1979962 RepID=UPI00261CA083|nr:uracil-DNA glycosylase [Pusillimonas sp. (ex Stolz et al. 2005)]